tara:strand:+ start:208 stop:498 length:291 start_codon:yes stop_codon:yes gene_type:complete
MKKYLTFRPDGTVIAVSNSKNEIAKHLKCEEFDIDKEKEEQNWTRKIQDEKLIYEKPPHIETDEKKQKIEDIKENINKAETVEEIKKQTKQLVDLI